MRQAAVRWLLGAVLAGAGTTGWCAAPGETGATKKLKTPRALYVAQEYNLQERGSTRSRHQPQKLYLTAHQLKIEDEIETVFIDLEKETVTTVDHRKKRYKVDTFPKIRDHIQKRIRNLKKDISDLPAGKERDDMIRAFAGLLEWERAYRGEFTGEKEICRYEDQDNTAIEEACQVLRISLARGNAWQPAGKVIYEAALSPTYQVPFDNSEVLYLLELVGPDLARQLREYKNLPLRVKLDLANGGTLEAKVTRIEEREAFPKELWHLPQGYQEEGQIQPYPFDPG